MSSQLFLDAQRASYFVCSQPLSKNIAWFCLGCFKGVQEPTMYSVVYRNNEWHLLPIELLPLTDLNSIFCHYQKYQKSGTEKVKKTQLTQKPEVHVRQSNALIGVLLFPAIASVTFAVINLFFGIYVKLKHISLLKHLKLELFLLYIATKFLFLLFFFFRCWK